MKKINLNHAKIWLGDCPFGRSSFIVKAGRKTFRLDIDKNKLSAFVDIFDNNAKSKYGEAQLCTIRLNIDAFIDRDFVENAKEAETAQRLYEKYKNIIDF